MCQMKAQGQKIWNLQDGDNGIQEDVRADDISIKRFVLEMTDYRQTREWQQKLKWRNESACPGDRLGEEVFARWKTAPSS